MDVIEQAQNRAFSTYRAMVNSTLCIEPSLDSGYVSNPSRASSSREGDVSNLTMNLSTAELEGADKAPEAASAPFTGTELGFERTSPIHRDLINPSDSYPQTHEAVSNDPLSLEGNSMNNLLLFPMQPWGLNSDIDSDA